MKVTTSRESLSTETWKQCKVVQVFALVIIRS